MNIDKLCKFLKFYNYLEMNIKFDLKKNIREIKFHKKK